MKKAFSVCLFFSSLALGEVNREEVLKERLKKETGEKQTLEKELEEARKKRQFVSTEITRSKQWNTPEKREEFLGSSRFEFEVYRKVEEKNVSIRDIQNQIKALTTDLAVFREKKTGIKDLIIQFFDSLRDYIALLEYQLNSRFLTSTVDQPLTLYKTALNSVVEEETNESPNNSLLDRNALERKRTNALKNYSKNPRYTVAVQDLQMARRNLFKVLAADTRISEDLENIEKLQRRFIEQIRNDHLKKGISQASLEELRKAFNTKKEFGLDEIISSWLKQYDKDFIFNIIIGYQNPYVALGLPEGELTATQIQEAYEKKISANPSNIDDLSRARNLLLYEKPAIDDLLDMSAQAVGPIHDQIKQMNSIFNDATAKLGDVLRSIIPIPS
jgi:hypothetical protein